MHLYMCQTQDTDKLENRERKQYMGMCCNRLIAEDLMFQV